MAKPRQIAVINAGSSSIKFAVFHDDPAQSLIFRGQMEKIGVAPTLTVEGSGGETILETEWGAKEINHGSATKVILQTSISLLGGEAVEGIGHRVVHGGTKFNAPTPVTKDVLASLKELCPLAPLHQPHNLSPIEAIMTEAPHIPQVACFDTAFHQTQPHLSQAFALPREITDLGVRRYGFHGLSYEFVSDRLRSVAPDYAQKRIIIAHLGNGASLCGIHKGRSVATTMGFTAVEGLMMGTRCGSIDPGVLLYLMQAEGLDLPRLTRLLYQESGLLGVSGVSASPQLLLEVEHRDARARAALELYVRRIVREIGSLTAALGGLDMLAFTAGVGEHSAVLRERICAALGWLGVELDDAANLAHAPVISQPGSRVRVVVEATNEEWIAATHALPFVGDQAAAIAARRGESRSLL